MFEYFICTYEEKSNLLFTQKQQHKKLDMHSNKDILWGRKFLQNIVSNTLRRTGIPIKKLNFLFSILLITYC